jgi:ubiquinone biosynthesis protein
MVSPVKTVAKDIKRARDIVRVLMRHGLDAFVEGTGLSRFVSSGEEQKEDLIEELDLDDEQLPDGEIEDPAELLGDDRSQTAIRFRNVLEELGPTYVKLGQILSTRPDILPNEFIEEFKNLQDDVPPLDHEVVAEQIASELDGEPDELFAHFEADPLAAASIGQVHRATLKDGTEVVVKVQRPGIRDKIQSDLDILYYLARFLEATIQEVELYTPTAIVEEFETAILTELDFEKEAYSIEEFGENFKETEEVGVPSVYRAYSTRKILTMEFVEAIPIGDVAGGTPRAHQLLDNLLDAIVEMVLYDGFFHGDPHPGNILVTDDDKLVFIDFGIVGRLSSSQQDNIIELVLTTLTGDIDGMARTLLRMGYPVGRIELRKFKADITKLREKYITENIDDINVSEFVQEVMNAAQEHRIRIDPKYAVLTKASMTVEGIMRHLQPDLDIMEKGRPYARELAMHRFSAKKLLRGTLSSAMGLSGFIQQLPQQMDQVLMDLESGNLTVQVDNEAMNEMGPYLNTLGTRIFLGIFSSGLAICAAIVFQGFEYALFGVSLRLIIGLLLIGGSFTLFWWALGWHIFGGGANKKLKISPFLRLLRDE